MLWDHILCLGTIRYYITHFRRKTHVDIRFSLVSRIVSVLSVSMCACVSVTAQMALNCFNSAKEALAIIYGVKRFHEYLYDGKFTIFSYRKPLMYIFSKAKSIPRMVSSHIQRWAILLSGYDYLILYIPERDLIGADALSRLPVSSSLKSTPDPGDYILLLNVVNQSPVTASKIRYWTNRDPELGKVYSCVERGWPRKLNKNVNLSSYFNRKQELTTLQNCLIWGSWVIVPKQCHKTLLDSLHDNHMGVSRTKTLARQYVWWPKMDCHLLKATVLCSHSSYSSNFYYMNAHYKSCIFL